MKKSFRSRDLAKILNFSHLQEIGFFGQTMALIVHFLSILKQTVSGKVRIKKNNTTNISQYLKKIAFRVKIYFSFVTNPQVTQNNYFFWGTSENIR